MGRVKPLLVAFLFYYVLSALKALVVGVLQDDVVGAVRVCLSGDLADGPIWFLLALAEVCLFVKVLFWLVRNDALRLLMSVVIFAVVCRLGASVSFNPLFFFQAMAMQFFYVCGYFMYNKTFRGGGIYHIISNLKEPYAAVAMFLFLLSLVVSRSDVDVFLLRFGNPLDLVVSGFAGTLLVLMFCNVMRKKVGWLASVGKYSLHIMGLHKLLISPLYSYVFIPMAGLLDSGVSGEAVFGNQALALGSALFVTAVSYYWGVFITRHCRLFRG